MIIQNFPKIPILLGKPHLNSFIFIIHLQSGSPNVLWAKFEKRLGEARLIMLACAAIFGGLSSQGIERTFSLTSGYTR